MKDPFDLIDLSDLPEELVKRLERSHNRSVPQDKNNLLSLFELKNELSLSEVVVGMFRHYGLTKKKHWYLNTINRLVGKGILKIMKGSVTTYKKVEGK